MEKIWVETTSFQGYLCLKATLKTKQAESDGVITGAKPPFVTTFTANEQRMGELKRFLHDPGEMELYGIKGSGMVKDGEYVPWPEEAAMASQRVEVDLVAQNKAAQKNSVQVYLNKPK